MITIKIAHNVLYWAY